MALFMSVKTGFTSKTVTRVKGHFIMIKGSMHQEYITIINIHAANIRAPKYVKETLTQIKK